ncbi:hypothetical protein [Novosphingobium gossypii]|uniref:hypothetical protein n=1 Tax=Novosphingobium gossypii TaxID=1604774 RepID=UPI003D2114CD
MSERAMSLAYAGSFDLDELCAPLLAMASGRARFALTLPACAPRRRVKLPSFDN